MDPKKRILTVSLIICHWGRVLTSHGVQKPHPAKMTYFSRHKMTSIDKCNPVSRCFQAISWIMKQSMHVSVCVSEISQPFPKPCFNMFLHLFTKSVTQLKPLLIQFIPVIPMHPCKTQVFPSPTKASLKKNTHTYLILESTGKQQTQTKTNTRKRTLK